MQQQEFRFKVDEKSIQDISKSIANEVANRIYYEFLIARYMPEILSIEKGGVEPQEAEIFKQQIMQKIKSMGE